MTTLGKKQLQEDDINGYQLKETFNILSKERGSSHAHKQVPPRNPSYVKI